MPCGPTHRVGVAAAALALLLSAPAIGAASSRAPVQARVNQDAQLIADFLKRVQAYVEVHKKADSTLPELSNSATSDQVDAHQQALQRLIGTARQRAERGDIFTRPIRAYFRRQLARALSGPDAAQIKAAILEENPGPIKLRVNAAYPESIPILTMPPQILAALPKLPKDLEFRFIGERLILLDVHAQLVADYMDDALPR